MAGETVRRRVDVADNELDFPILHDLKTEGATDYFALPVKNSFGTNYMVTYVTDRPGGFTVREISDLTRVSQRLSLLADLRQQRLYRHQHPQRLSRPQDWPKVLEGQILAWHRLNKSRPSYGRQICAVSRSVPIASYGTQVIAMLNALFDAQAEAIAGHGGENPKIHWRRPARNLSNRE